MIEKEDKMSWDYSDVLRQKAIHLKFEPWRSREWKKQCKITMLTEHDWNEENRLTL